LSIVSGVNKDIALLMLATGLLLLLSVEASIVWLSAIIGMLLI
jgi:hypothetical protein